MKDVTKKAIASSPGRLVAVAGVALALAGCVTIPQLNAANPAPTVSVAALATDNKELIRARWGAYTDLMGNSWWGTGGNNGYGAQLKWTIPGAEAVEIMTVNNERTPLKLQYNPEKRALDIFDIGADNKLIRQAVVKPDGSVAWTAEMLGLVSERRIAYDAAQGMLLDTDGLRVVMKPVTPEAHEVAYQQRVEAQRVADRESEARKEAFWDGVVEAIAGVGEVLVGVGEVLGTVVEGVAMAAPAIQQSYAEQQRTSPTYPAYPAKPYTPPQAVPQRIAAAPAPAPSPQQYRPAASPIAAASRAPSASTSRTVPPKTAPMQMAKAPQMNFPAPMMTPNVPAKSAPVITASNTSAPARIGPCKDRGNPDECFPRKPEPCKTGESRVNGKCVRNPLVCPSPMVKFEERCVWPPGTNNGAGSNGNGTGGKTGVDTKPPGRDAKHCIILTSRPDRPNSRGSQIITNRCSERIDVIYCHSPTSLSGTGNSVCGNNGRYYQQHPQLSPGESHDNYFTLPLGTIISYGACFGGFRSAQQTANGGYDCR